jgi:hypothetical protein
VNSSHRSRGTELIRKRLRALSHFVSEPISIDMSPAYDDSRNPGNKVVLIVPAGLYKAWLHANGKQGVQP